ncbi:hypothetical protein LTR62_002967 [Meristemomyces frigidus]|uniref:Uncharacterized protein n=1 Tax=Meristemomyces frigidus TaxID=1508187 RepID=A0AAN7TRU3_9PEZI|nr:hypothetical protein LTR62_002967 [Meristemomyces frigidus]
MGQHSEEEPDDVLITIVEDGEGDEVLEIKTPLVGDDLPAGQLGTHIYRNPPEHQNLPRDLITAAEKKNAYYQQVRFHRAKYGKYNGLDACLIVFKLSFQTLRSTLRFKSAELEVEFDDAANLGLNPYEVDLDTTFRPRVLRHEPGYFKGPVSEVQGSSTVKLDIPIQAPGGIVGITPGISRSRDTLRESAFEVHGVVKEDPPSLVHWVMREDGIKDNGIRPELAVAIIVQYFPPRRFFARVRFKADLFMTSLRPADLLSTFVKPVCGLKDDPVFFDPEYMQSGQSSTGATAIVPNSAPYATVPGLEAQGLDDEDLQKLTKIKDIGGQFGG